MPYIEEALRPYLDSTVTKPKTTGELNYRFTRSAVDYLDQHGLRYATINDVLGAFVGGLLEFYLRVAVPYEAGKLAANGDVGYERYQPQETGPLDPKNTSAEIATGPICGDVLAGFGDLDRPFVCTLPPDHLTEQHSYERRPRNA